jgi:sulfoxide reductase catalytic subunit YedY
MAAIVRPRYTARVPTQRVTPPDVFFNRRQFLTALGAGLFTSLPTGIVGGAGEAQSAPQSLLEVPFRRPEVFPPQRNETYGLPRAITHAVPVLGGSQGRGDTRAPTPREVAASHNNFYEFLPGRGGPVWQFCGDFEVEPWRVEITGECHNPMTLDLDDLFAFDHEERLYHFRCVERWAMNVPWSGFPLSRLLERVEPTSAARYVRFESAVARDQMPGVRNAGWYSWPYHEGLRLDEALNELTLVVTGVYGQPLLRQHGAPVRIVVPWKYGYKNPKSIVKIELTRGQPDTFWQVEQPHEYGFLSNVNPNVPHPRWPQSVSYWLDTEEQFVTPIFNGYEQYVAELYPDEPRVRQQPLTPGQAAR